MRLQLGMTFKFANKKQTIKIKKKYSILVYIVMLIIPSFLNANDLKTTVWSNLASKKIIPY